jgi:hypothetical protein
MVRHKRAHAIPNQTFSIKDQDGTEIPVEAWDDYVDKGKRGSHRRALSAKLFNKVLCIVYEHYLSSDSQITREYWRKMIYGDLKKSKLVQETLAIARRSNISIARSTAYKIAAEIQTATKAFDSALIKKNSGEGHT